MRSRGAGASSFDRRNGHDFKTYNVGTKTFEEYITQMTGYQASDGPGVTDIGVLCDAICGVNLSVGYRDEHTPQETLDTQEWLHTLSMARQWLSTEELPIFPLNPQMKLTRE